MPAEAGLKPPDAAMVKSDVYCYQWTKPHVLGQKGEKDERA